MIDITDDRWLARESNRWGRNRLTRQTVDGDFSNAGRDAPPDGSAREDTEKPL